MTSARSTETGVRATAPLLRQLHTREVLGALQRRGPLSRAEIVRLTGISSPTVTRTTAQLLAAGLIEEGPSQHPPLGRPARVLLGAYLFGGVTMLQFHLQGEGVELPSQWLGMLPYLSTIAVLALISRDAGWVRLNMPASLGKSFNPAR